jgi:hypothetical protein
MRMALACLSHKVQLKKIHTMALLIRRSGTIITHIRLATKRTSVPLIQLATGMFKHPRTTCQVQMMSDNKTRQKNDVSCPKKYRIETMGIAVCHPRSKELPPVLGN